MIDRRLLLKCLATSPLMGWAGNSVFAEDVKVAIVMDSGAPHRATAASLEAELSKAGVSDEQVAAIPMQNWPGANPAPAVVVAVGPGGMRAVAARPGIVRPVVAVQISRVQLDAVQWGETNRVPDQWSAVVNDQPYPRWMALAELLLTSRRNVGILFSPATLGYQKQIERAATERGLSFHWELVAAENQLIPALEKLLGKVNLLLALPDPNVHNRATVQPILLTTYRAGIPLIGYSESYTNAGAVLSLHSGADQVGRQAAEFVLAALKGRPVSGIFPPRQFRVSVNSTVARSLGLHLPTTAEIEERLP
ncbi:MAG TPA: ABC transporter substrate binding protein [Rhodocyclaceae bacterium]|nr:ABC transporter substrate binding protein [Rhodocyclaceae bacterium]HNH34932.1 ABC transporter substrate binding protein [Rhodocyclaceae bacterium]